MQRNITDVKGIRVRGCHIGIKSKRRDLAMIVSDVPASAAAVYTTNLVQAHPLLITKENLRDGRAQAILVTSGNANACNGPDGMKGARKAVMTLASELNISEKDVIVANIHIQFIYRKGEVVKIAEILMIVGKNLEMNPQ